MMKSLVVRFWFNGEIYVIRCNFVLQKNHRSLVQTRLQVTHVDIVGTMKQTYEVFKHDGQEVMLLTSRLQ